MICTYSGPACIELDFDSLQALVEEADHLNSISAYYHDLDQGSHFLGAAWLACLFPPLLHGCIAYVQKAVEREELLNWVARLPRSLSRWAN